MEKFIYSPLTNFIMKKWKVGLAGLGFTSLGALYFAYQWAGYSTTATTIDTTIHDHPTTLREITYPNQDTFLNQQVGDGNNNLGEPKDKSLVPISLEGFLDQPYNQIENLPLEKLHESLFALISWGKCYSQYINIPIGDNSPESPAECRLDRLAEKDVIFFKRYINNHRGDLIYSIQNDSPEYNTYFVTPPIFLLGQTLKKVGAANMFLHELGIDMLDIAISRMDQFNDDEFLQHMNKFAGYYSGFFPLLDMNGLNKMNRKTHGKTLEVLGRFEKKVISYGTDTSRMYAIRSVYFKDILEKLSPWMHRGNSKK